MNYYESLRYFVDGNGLWMSRWDCTGQDIYLLCFTVFSFCFMAYEYIRYGYYTTKYEKCIDDVLIKSHLCTLNRVMFQCLIIHFFVMVLSWIYPSYYLVCVIMVYNSLYTRKLNRERKQILSVEIIRREKQNANTYTEGNTLKQQLQCHIDKLEGSCKWTQS